MKYVLEICKKKHGHMVTEQTKENGKTGISEFPIINGVFSTSEASEIIMHLIHEKINFLKIRSLRQFIRYGTDDDWSLARVEELKQSGESIKELIEEAKREGKTLSIQSTISIEVI